MLKILRCLVTPHEPDRRRVKKLSPDEAYRGVCRKRGARIVQLKRNRWVRDWLWRLRQQ